MIQINFPQASAYNNSAAHEQIRTLMKQHRQLSIKFDNDANAWISTKALTGLQYELSVRGWFWLFRYLTTGEYEDFKVHESKRITMENLQERIARFLIYKGCNVFRIPILRETTRYIRLVAVFSFGKFFLNVERSDEFINFLLDHNL